MGQRVPPENTGPHRPFRQRPRLHLSPRFETGFGSFSPDPHKESIPADCREYRAFIVLQSLPGRSLHLERRLMHVVRLHEVQRMRRTKSVLCLCRVTVASPPCDASDASLKTLPRYVLPPLQLRSHNSNGMQRVRIKLGHIQLPPTPRSGHYSYPAQNRVWFPTAIHIDNTVGCVVLGTRVKILGILDHPVRGKPQEATSLSHVWNGHAILGGLSFTSV